MPSAIIDAATGARREIVAAKTGYKIRVLGWIATNATQGTMIWESATTARTGAMPFGADGGCTAPVGPGWFDTATGAALNMTVSAGTAKGVVRFAYVLPGDPNG